MARQIDLDDPDASASDESSERALSRKDRMQMSSKVEQNKSVLEQSAVVKSEKPTKVSKATSYPSLAKKSGVDHGRDVSRAPSPDPRRELGACVMSSPPTDAPKEDDRRQVLPTINHRQPKETTIVQFGREGPRSELQVQPERSRERNRDLHSEPVKKTLGPTLAGHKPSRPKLVKEQDLRQVNDSNIAGDNEDALAGFDTKLMRKPDKTSRQSQSTAISHTTAVLSKNDKTSRQQAESSHTTAVQHPGQASQEPTSSQIAMPPPKQATKSKKMITALDVHNISGSEGHHNSGSERGHNGRGTRKKSNAKVNNLTIGADAGSVSRSAASQQHRAAIEASTCEGPFVGHQAAEDSGYISATKSAATTTKDAQNRGKNVPITKISDQGSPMLTTADTAGINAVANGQPFRNVLGDKDTSDEEPEMSTLRGKGQMLTSGQAALFGEVQEAISAARNEADGTKAQISLDHNAEVAASDSREQRSAAIPLSMEEILDWRSKLQAHQRCLFDRLVNDAETLVSYLVRREEVIQDVVDDYRTRGQDLIKHMEVMHAKEYEQYCSERDARRNRALD